MDIIRISLPILLVVSALAQYDGFDAYEGHHGYHKLSEHGSDDHHHEYELDYHAHPKYSFDYSVKDPHTGDNKDHWETRDGDKVKGTYTLLETDGTKRVVEYEADDKNGFNAVVHKIGTPKHEPQEPAFHGRPHETIAFHQKPHEPVEFHGRPHEPVEFHGRPHETAAFQGKPVHEPIGYHNDYGYDDGFVPVVGGFGH